jgi:hypothetical protein
MDAGDGSSASALSEGRQRAGPSSIPPRRQSGQAPVPHRPATRPAARRPWAALAWAAGAAALFALYLRIKLAGAPSSDPANNALQAWDLLHGHLLLHGWILGDVTFYTFELPLMALVELFFGLHNIAVHVTVALTYLIVTACAVAIAVSGAAGAARAVRAGVVAAVLAAPVLVVSDIWITLGFPDHTGTTVFLLVCCLLMDRSCRSRGGSGGSSPPEPAGWFTAPLLCLILAAGQIGDVTVRYVAVPAVIVVCAYRVLARRTIRSGDAANLVAAALSLPLATALRALMRHSGGYLMISPKTFFAPYSQWGQNAAYTWHSIRMLFGTVAAPGGGSAGLAAIFGWACMAVAGIGVLRVLWRWRRARRSEQLLLVAIVANIVVYMVSTLPAPKSPHDIVAVLPAGAILGARAVVPSRITGRRTALVATCAAAVAALLPLSLQAAARPPQVPAVAALTAWLEAHGLRYGLGGYWDSSVVTLQSGGDVVVRSVEETDGQITPNPWEANLLWYDPTRYYANFVIFQVAGNSLGQHAMRYFGTPVSINRLGAWDVLIYNTNVLQWVNPPLLPQTS